jgi:hypothetical protein
MACVERGPGPRGNVQRLRDSSSTSAVARSRDTDRYRDRGNPAQREVLASEEEVAIFIFETLAKADDASARTAAACGRQIDLTDDDG